MGYLDVGGNTLLEGAISGSPKEQHRVKIGQKGMATRILVWSADGSFVGTLQAQDDQSGAFLAIDTVPVGASGTVNPADPTQPGFYASTISSDLNLDTLQNVRIVFSSFTSGSVVIATTDLHQRP